MTDSEQKDASRKHEPLRVVDRRPFNSEGERRSSDAAAEEYVPAPPALPPVVPSGGPAASAGAAAPVASPHFQNLVLNLGRQAAASLGAARHPLTGQIEVDLEGGQQMITLLQALLEKTRGNLTDDESDLLEGLIGDLQMQYVATRSKATKKP